jgi:hypothetical protein
MTERYFIRDCNGRVLGNTKGYTSHKSAKQGIRKGTKALDYAWAAAFAQGGNGATVWQIKLEKVAA